MFKMLQQCNPSNAFCVQKKCHFLKIFSNLFHDLHDQKQRFHLRLLTSDKDLIQERNGISAKLRWH